MERIGAFITPHGYGHATRSIGVLEALQRAIPTLAIDICTTVPQHLFTSSLNHVSYHHIQGDVGLIQHDALTIDLEATAHALDRLLPFSTDLVDGIAARLQGCNLILADIAPLGILAAERLGIPSVLVENFTWDWIYSPYLSACPALSRHILILADIYTRATLHIQCEPVCRPAADAKSCPPIFRRQRTSAQAMRTMLQAGDRKIVLLSMGGFDFHLPAWQQLPAGNDFLLVLAGQSETAQLSDNCLTLSRTSEIHHPDLIGCSDLAVFKSGYSTVAECLQGGTRALCISRPLFAESEILELFVKKRLGGDLLTESDFLSGSWLKRIDEFLDRPGPDPATVNGADCAARYIEALCPS